MAAPSLTWKDLGILKDALDEFERTLEDLGIEAGEVSWHIDGSIHGEFVYGTRKLITNTDDDGEGFSHRYE